MICSFETGDRRSFLPAYIPWPRRIPDQVKFLPTSPPQFLLLPTRQRVHKQHHVITQTQQPPAIEELLPPPPASIQKKDAKARNPGKGGVTSPAVSLPSPHFPAHQASSSNPATGPQVPPPHPGPQFGGLGAISWKREMCSSAWVSCRHGLRFLFFSFFFPMDVSGWPGSWGVVVRDSGDGCHRCQSQSSLWNQKSYVLV